MGPRAFLCVNFTRVANHVQHDLPDSVSVSRAELRQIVAQSNSKARLFRYGPGCDRGLSRLRGLCTWRKCVWVNSRFPNRFIGKSRRMALIRFNKDYAESVT